MSITPPYKSFQFDGPLNVACTPPRELERRNTKVYVLMGPTGSGKSAFIEWLSDGTLSISKDTLESVTQEVVCYRVVKWIRRYRNDPQIIFMDTPGFLDNKLSESRIATMIRTTLHEIRQSVSFVFVGVIYFHPITDIRLAASKQDVARLMTAFTKSLDANHIMVATTMWNTIHTPKRMADAEARLLALEADIFKSSVDMVFSVHKFEFSWISVLLIIDNVLYSFFSPPYVNTDPAFDSMAWDNLLNRISQAKNNFRYSLKTEYTRRHLEQMRIMNFWR